MLVCGCCGMVGLGCRFLLGFGGLRVCIGFVLVIAFVVFGCFAGCLVVMSLLVMGFS